MRRLLLVSTIYNLYFVSVVGTAPELHVTVLLVKREPLHIDLAGGLVDGWRCPLDVSSELELGLGHQSDLVLAVSTEQTP